MQVHWEFIGAIDIAMVLPSAGTLTEMLEGAGEAAGEVSGDEEMATQ